MMLPANEGALVRVYTRKCPLRRAVCERTRVTVPRRDVKPLIRRMFSSLSPFRGSLLCPSSFLPLSLSLSTFVSFLTTLLRVSGTRSPAIVVNLPVYTYVPVMCVYIYIYICDIYIYAYVYSHIYPFVGIVTSGDRYREPLICYEE